MTETPIQQGAFLIAVANEIDIHLDRARRNFPGHGAEFDRIAANTKMMREKAEAISEMELGEIPSEELFAIRDLLTSTIEMTRAFEDGQRLQ